MPTAATALLAFFALVARAGVMQAQNPLGHATDAVEIRFSQRQPVIAYTLRVDSADLTGFAVELRVRNAPDTFQLAMAAHPEYDDRYWRFLGDLRVEGRTAQATVTREDSALWRVIAPEGEVTVRYRIRRRPVRCAPHGGLSSHLQEGSSAGRTRFSMLSVRR